MRILLLGGTTEASALAADLAARDVDAIFSYAGVTRSPLAQPLPTRTGGFGGIEGLRAYLRAHAITHVVDATHPFAAQMSRHAIAACLAERVALTALERPPWTPNPGETWTHVPDVDAARDALPQSGARVFLAIGRQQIGTFAAKPGNFYLLRMIDPPKAALPLPQADIVTGRGPFTREADTALMRHHRIDTLVAKNGGATRARAKLDAARALNIRVIMIDRPDLPPRHICRSVAEIWEWLAHPADRLV